MVIKNYLGNKNSPDWSEVIGKKQCSQEFQQSLNGMADSISTALNVVEVKKMHAYIEQQEKPFPQNLSGLLLAVKYALDDDDANDVVVQNLESSKEKLMEYKNSLELLAICTQGDEEEVNIPTEAQGLLSGFETRLWGKVEKIRNSAGGILYDRLRSGAIEAKGLQKGVDLKRLPIPKENWEFLNFIDHDSAEYEDVRYNHIKLNVPAVKSKASLTKTSDVIRSRVLKEIPILTTDNIPDMARDVYEPWLLKEHSDKTIYTLSKIIETMRTVLREHDPAGYKPPKRGAKPKNKK